jgi:serine/threonine protein kinase
MPRNYRTPDLIDYLKGGPPPTDKSDVYQLGLVFAEMFSGSNPQRAMKAGDFTEPIELVPFTIPGGLGSPIKDLIEPMLIHDPARRLSAGHLLPPWQDLFLEAAKRAHDLDGRVV